MTLRELFVDWLTASRYVKWLEARHHEQRQDYTERLAEKDAQIKQLRAEIAGLKLECDRMRSVLMPYASTAGAEYSQKFVSETKPVVVPEFAGPDDWQSELNKMYAAQKAEEWTENPVPDYQAGAETAREE